LFAAIFFIGFLPYFPSDVAVSPRRRLGNIKAFVAGESSPLLAQTEVSKDRSFVRRVDFVPSFVNEAGNENRQVIIRAFFCTKEATRVDLVRWEIRNVSCCAVTIDEVEVAGCSCCVDVGRRLGFEGGEGNSAAWSNLFWWGSGKVQRYFDLDGSLEL